MEINTMVKETIAAVLYAIFVWATKASSSTNQSPKKTPSFYDHTRIGLTSILYSKKGHHQIKEVVHSCTITSSTRPSARTMASFSLPSLSSSTSWSSSTTGDLIGTESGVFMSSGDDTIPALWEGTREAKPSCSTQRSSSRARLSRNIDIPPPVSFLGRDGKSKRIHSWCLGRECVDGRLILRVTHENYGNNHFDDVDEGNGEQKVEVDGGFVENKEENENGNENFFVSDEELFKNMGNRVNEISFASSVPEESMHHDMEIDVGRLRRSVSYSGGLDFSIMDFLDPNPLASSPLDVY